MLRILSVIVWCLIFYLAFKAIKYFVQMLSGPKEGEEVKSSFNRKKEKNKFSINREDIIEADFEEIKESDSEKKTKD